MRIQKVPVLVQLFFRISQKLHLPKIYFSYLLILVTPIIPPSRIADLLLEVIANQLTLLDSKLFSRILSEEFVFRAWKGNEKRITAPYVTQLIDRLLWVIDHKVEIWISEKEKKEGKIRKRPVLRTPRIFRELYNSVSILHQGPDLSNFFPHPDPQGTCPHHRGDN